MKNLNWKAIGLGVFIYISLMTLFFIILATGLIARESMAGRSLENIDESVFITTPVLIITLIIDSLVLLVGAYVSAAHSDSRKSAVVHAFIMAAISTAVVSLTYFVESEPYPLWYNILAYGSILPTAYIGGSWRWRNLSRANPVLETSQSPFPELPRR